MGNTVWMVTGIVFLGQILLAIANVSQGVLLTSFIDAFHLESTLQGLPNAAANAGILIAMLLSVSMAARMGKLRLFTVGMGLLAVTLAFAGASASIVWLVCAYLLIGFSLGCIDTTTSSIVADVHQGKRASVLMGMLHALYSFGGVLIPLLINSALHGGASWRIILWVMAIAAAVVCALAVVVLLRARGNLPVGVAPPNKLTAADFRAFAKQKGNLLLVLCTWLYCAHQCSIYLWVNRIFEIRFDNAALGAITLSLFWVGTGLSRLFTPMTGIPVVRYLRYGMLLTAAVLALGIAIGSPIVICIATAVCGLFGGAFLPMALTEATKRNPERTMFSVSAVLLTTAASAIVCAPLIGFIVGKTSLIAALVIAAVFAVCSSACAFGLREIR